jgi:uncharacterized protein (DUF2252 family)
MLASPFAFFRGAALNMAADLAGTPVSGLRVQACGDCHLLNFGAFATPERRVVFDINDLDETLPAPWEWDVKRLAVSFLLAGRSNGFREDQARDAVLACVRSYREQLRVYSRMRTLDVWYASIDAEQLVPLVDDETARTRLQKRLGKARGHNPLEHDFPKLANTDGPNPRIQDQPPLIFHWRERSHEEYVANIQRAFALYRETLQEDRRQLLDRFQLMDLAFKVVGVGSVGTLCGIMLLMALGHDPLFLQIKQARPSVLEAFAGASRHANHGERVVHGYRMMQSASDIFLGWTHGELGRQFYVRQLKDMKAKPQVDVFTPAVMQQYARLCGRTLAHAHARSGDSAKISGYLGRNDQFDEAIATFAKAYADQSESDHAQLVRAARRGRLDVATEAT